MGGWVVGWVVGWVGSRYTKGAISAEGSVRRCSNHLPPQPHTTTQSQAKRVVPTPRNSETQRTSAPEMAAHVPSVRMLRTAGLSLPSSVTREAICWVAATGDGSEGEGVRFRREERLG